ncbi:unnamed protein product [Ectocarpus sp. 12 AP-2014]
MARFLPSGGGVGGKLSSGQEHPLLLWLDVSGYEQSGPLLLLSIAAYYLLLFACGWFVLQWFRRGRPWARARSFLAGKSKSDLGAAGVGGKREPAPPQLRYKKTAFNRRLLSETTVLRQPYVPSPWLGHRLGGHMQSFMFATWCPPGDRAMVSRLVSRQDRVESSFDGGVFRMDWFDLRETPLPADAPVVFVLPGVVGQGTNVYIRHLAAHLSTKYGYRVVTKNWRGIGLELSTRRPETWDHAALSDCRDAIKHLRREVGEHVPVLGVGFSFGGCVLTAIAGTAPQEEHGLCGLVSISGLFDMPAMMKHIAEQYAYPYGFANTKVTVKNYRKFKVLETLTAEADASVTGGRSSGPIRNSSSCFSDDEGMGVGRSSSSSTAEEPLRPSTGPMRTRKKLRSALAAAGAAAATVEAGSSAPSQAPSSASAIASPAARPSLSAGSGASGGLVDAQMTPTTAAAEAVASRRGDEVFHTASLLDSGHGKEGEVAVLAGAGPGAGVTSGLVTAKEMAAMKDPSAFHEALTLPFTGDSSVDAYFQRIGRVMGQNVSSVTVPTLCLLAKDDPLCPPHAWVGALEAAAKSDGIVVAITEHGGHCGWFDGLGAGSWLDRATGNFLSSALELSKEPAAARAIADHGASPIAEASTRTSEAAESREPSVCTTDHRR